MRRRVTRLAIVVFAVASAAFAGPMPAPNVLPTPQPYIGFAGGDGSRCDQAVVITGANHETEGIRAQRWWVFSKHVGSKVLGQSVSSANGRDLEIFDIILADGTRKQICFDITSFYGKP